MSQRSFLLLCLIFASLTAHADKVDDYIKVQMQRKHIPGLSLAVIKDGKLLKAKGYGYASLELDAPATSATVYQLASVTKQFTATAILLLVQDGKLHFDDKISQHLDGTPAIWKDITVRHLLTHTSGIHDYLNEETKQSLQNTTPEKIMQTVSGLPLDFSSGAKYAYSNTNYVLLASIVHKASGKSYDQFLAERVFQPLGMTATRRTSPVDVIPARAAGYTWSDSKWQNSAYLDPTLWDNGDGGMLSTVLDLVKWDAALDGDAILTEASKQQMWTPVRLNDGTSYGYGFGWGLDEVQGHRRITHNGGRPGTSTAISRYVKDKLTVIVLANVNNNCALDIADRLAGFYVPALGPYPYKPIPDTEPKVTTRIRAILDGFAQRKMGPDLLPPGISVAFLTGFPEPIHSWKALSDFIHDLGNVHSLALVERKVEGEDRLSRYRATYPKDRLLFACWLNKDDKIVRIGFQIE